MPPCLGPLTELGPIQEVLLILHALIHTFVSEHLVQWWKEAGSGLS